jgi:hypothetical protein
MREGLTESNPVALTNHHDHSTGRDRVTEEELVEIWRAATSLSSIVQSTFIDVILNHFEHLISTSRRTTGP